MRRTRNMRVLLTAGRGVAHVMRHVEPAHMVPNTAARRVLRDAGIEAETRARAAVRLGIITALFFAVSITLPVCAARLIGTWSPELWALTLVVGAPVAIMVHQLLVGYALNRLAVALAGPDPVEGSED